MPHNGVHIDEQVFLLLGQTYAQAKKMADRELRKLGITHAEYSLLRVLENSPGITASEMRARLSASAPAIAQLIKVIESKELIVRAADAGDSRRQLVTLTKHGATLVRKARGDIQKALERVGADAAMMKSLVTNLTELSLTLSSIRTS